MATPIYIPLSNNLKVEPALVISSMFQHEIILHLPLDCVEYIFTTPNIKADVEYRHHATIMRCTPIVTSLGTIQITIPNSWKNESDTGNIKNVVDDLMSSVLNT